MFSELSDFKKKTLTIDYDEGKQSIKNMRAGQYDIAKDYSESEWNMNRTKNAIKYRKETEHVQVCCFSQGIIERT